MFWTTHFSHLLVRFFFSFSTIEDFKKILIVGSGTQKGNFRVFTLTSTPIRIELKTLTYNNNGLEYMTSLLNIENVLLFFKFNWKRYWCPSIIK